MTQNNRIPKLERRRLLCLFWFLIGFLIWQGAIVAQAVAPSIHTVSPVVTGLSLFGWAIWAYHLIRLLLLKRKMSDQEHQQMNDERVQQNRWRSFTAGFWAIMLTAALLILVPNALSAATAGHLLVIVGVGVGIGRFLYLESGGLSTVGRNNLGGMAHE